jgi:hypothetical protein
MVSKYYAGVINKIGTKVLSVILGRSFIYNKNDMGQSPAAHGDEF